MSLPGYLCFVCVALLFTAQLIRQQGPNAPQAKNSKIATWLFLGTALLGAFILFLASGSPALNSFPFLFLFGCTAIGGPVGFAINSSLRPTTFY